MLTISRLSRWSINYYNDTAQQASQAGLDRQEANGGLGEYYCEGDTRKHGLIHDAGGFGFVKQRLGVNRHQRPVRAGLTVRHDHMGNDVRIFVTPIKFDER